MVALSALSVKPRRSFSHEDVAKYLTVSRDNIVVAAFSAIVLVSISSFSRGENYGSGKGRRSGRKNIASKRERKKEKCSSSHASRGTARYSINYGAVLAGNTLSRGKCHLHGANVRGRGRGVTSARDTFFFERAALRVHRRDLWRAKPRIRDREISPVLPTIVTGCLLIVQHA